MLFCHSNVIFHSAICKILIQVRFFSNYKQFICYNIKFQDYLSQNSASKWFNIISYIFIHLFIYLFNLFVFQNNYKFQDYLQLASA